MRTVERFPHAVDETPDTGIVLADGTRLSARVWMPAGPGPFPAVLEFLPYRKRDGTTVRDALTHPWFAGHGLACLRVDMRGNGDSEGLMEDESKPGAELSSRSRSTNNAQGGAVISAKLAAATKNRLAVHNGVSEKSSKSSS